MTELDKYNKVLEIFDNLDYDLTGSSPVNENRKLFHNSKYKLRDAYYTNLLKTANYDDPNYENCIKYMDYIIEYNNLLKQEEKKIKKEIPLFTKKDSDRRDNIWKTITQYNNLLISYGNSLLELNQPSLSSQLSQSSQSSTPNIVEGNYSMFTRERSKHTASPPLNGGKRKRKTHKRKTHKRKTHKRKTHKRKTHKRKTHKRKTHKRKTHKRKTHKRKTHKCKNIHLK